MIYLSYDKGNNFPQLRNISTEIVTEILVEQSTESSQENKLYDPKCNRVDDKKFLSNPRH